jgi:hypothetical protein
MEVDGYIPRTLTTVIVYNNDGIERGERIFSSLRHAREYAQQIVNQFGDQDNWIFNRPVENNSFWINEKLNIEISIKSHRVLWPEV